MSDYDKHAQDAADAKYAKELADPKYTRISDDEILQQLDERLLGHGNPTMASQLRATPPEVLRERLNQIAAMPPGEIEQQQQDAFNLAEFNKQVEINSSHIAKYAADWADRLVAEADRMVEEAGRKRQQMVEFATEIRERGSKASAELKQEFEKIRAAGRQCTNAKRDFNK